ncbi:hypothetical protein BC2230_80382 [Burkholderia cepacia]
MNAACAESGRACQCRSARSTASAIAPRSMSVCVSVATAWSSACIAGGAVDGCDATSSRSSCICVGCMRGAGGVSGKVVCMEVAPVSRPRDGMRTVGLSVVEPGDERRLDDTGSVSTATLGMPFRQLNRTSPNLHRVDEFPRRACRPSPIFACRAIQSDSSDRDSHRASL